MPDKLSIQSIIYLFLFFDAKCHFTSKTPAKNHKNSLNPLRLESILPLPSSLAHLGMLYIN